MWNGQLSLISLLEDRCGDAQQLSELVWLKLCGAQENHPVQYDEAWMEQDKQKHAHKAMILLNTTRALKKFPGQISLVKVVNTFFQLRAIQTSTQSLSSVSAVLANHGRHPWTGEQVTRPETVKSLLSVMSSAGCSAQSREFSLEVGIPAKSSSEGALILVLPNVMGMCIVSPEVNHNDVSMGALHFCNAFAKEFKGHYVDHKIGRKQTSKNWDASLYHFSTDVDLCKRLLFAAQSGDLNEMSALHQLGLSMDIVDYDYRTAGHIAACNNQIQALRFLKKAGANLLLEDRWGSSPYDEARRCGRHEAASLLGHWLFT